MVLVSGAYWEDFLRVREWLAASKSQVFAGKEYWRLWTTLFIHGDSKHLISNSFLFFILGSLLAGYFGIFLIPVMAVLFGGITNIIVLLTMPENIKLIGASGIVFWMGGAWLTLYLLLDRRRTRLQRFLRAFGVGIVLFMPAEAFDPNVSYLAHLVGFVLGIGWGLVYFLLKRKPLRDAEIYKFESDPEANLESETPMDSF